MTTLLTIDQVAKLLSGRATPVKRCTVRRWVREGVKVRGTGATVKLAAVQLPSSIAFREADVLRFIEEMSGAAQQRGVEVSRCPGVEGGAARSTGGARERPIVGTYPPLKGAALKGAGLRLAPRSESAHAAMPRATG